MKTTFNLPTTLRLLCLCALLALVSTAQAAPPVVSNIRASQRAGTHLIDIYYNVSDADGNSPLTVFVGISDNAGASYNVPVFTLTGAVGPGVTLGNDRHIVWNAGTDWAGHFSSQCRVKIIADDGTAPPAPPGTPRRARSPTPPGAGSRFGHARVEAIPWQDLFESPADPSIRAGQL